MGTFKAQNIPQFGGSYRHLPHRGDLQEALHSLANVLPAAHRSLTPGQEGRRSLFATPSTQGVRWAEHRGVQGIGAPDISYS